MREIKFRAWCKEYNVMFSTNEISIMPTLRGEIFPLNIMESNESELSYNRINVIEQYELMQFTGLKDKNGKEIYEGDFVKLFQEDDEPTQISWSQEHAAWDFSGLGYFEISLGENELEVIGNIYENPELLNK